jgi:hypothetical protein
MRQHYRSPAIDAANKFFKQTSEKTSTDYEKAELAFRANRERLKAERLTREAVRQPRRDGTQ